MGRTLAISFLIVAVAAGGFLVGRFSAPSSAPANPTPLTPSIPSAPTPELQPHAAAVHQDPHAALLQALEMDGEDRQRAVRRAMHDWLAEEGAAALRKAGDDPRLAEVVGEMLQVALVVDPDIIHEDPSLLEGIVLGDRAITADAEAVISLGRSLAQSTLLGLELDAEMGPQMGSIAWSSEAVPLEEAYAEVESILAERSPMKRLPRLLTLMTRMAMSQPADAAALVDSLPASDRQPATDALISFWAQTDPQAAAQWLSSQQDQAAPQGFTQLAQNWGMQDFEGASDYAASLSGTQRQAFLAGLAITVERLPIHEQLAWVSNFQSEPNYPNLAMAVATQIARQDAGTALSLIESLPPGNRMRGYSQVLPSIAMENPEAAFAAIDTIADPSQRGQLVPMIASFWATLDPDGAMERMLDLAPGPVRDQALASMAQSLAQLDVERAIEAIDEVGDPAMRRVPVIMMLGLLEDESEAIRLGREHGFDRQAVLEVRANSVGMHSGTLMSMPMPMPFVFPDGELVDFSSSSVTGYIPTRPMVMFNDGNAGAREAEAQPEAGP